MPDPERQIVVEVDDSDVGVWTSCLRAQVRTKTSISVPSNLSTHPLLREILTLATGNQLVGRYQGAFSCVDRSQELGVYMLN